jgi:WD40 repeat protein
MALRPDGAVVATDDGEEVVLRSTELATTVPTSAMDGGFDGFSPELAFRPDGQVFAMADSGISETHDPARGRERLQLWNVADPTHPRPLGAPAYRDLDTPPRPQLARPPTALQFTPDGRYLLSLQGDGSVGVWDVSDPGAARSVGRLSTASGSYSGFAVSPDGHTVAAVSNSLSPMLDIWDITDPAQPARGGQRALATAGATVAFATAATLLVADGTRLTALPTDLDAQIRRICAEAGAELTEQQWREHVGPDIDRRPLC